MDALIRIKQLILEQRVRFTAKADHEQAVDDPTTREVYESILNASRIDKVLRSTSGHGRREKLYVIKGLTYSNLLVYTKGKITKQDDGEIFNILVSPKAAT